MMRNHDDGGIRDDAATARSLPPARPRPRFLRRPAAEQPATGCLDLVLVMIAGAGCGVIVTVAAQVIGTGVLRLAEMLAR